MTEFHLADWRPIPPDQFLQELHNIQMMLDEWGTTLRIETHELDGNRFITSFVYDLDNADGVADGCPLCILHVSAITENTPAKQLAFKHV